MSNANDPAFAGITYTEIPGGGARMHQIGGLTKREYFAAMAMQGLLSDPTVNAGGKDVAIAAVSYADALLAELEQTA